jgi:hypothetical protein
MYYYLDSNYELNQFEILLSVITPPSYLVTFAPIDIDYGQMN